MNTPSLSSTAFDHRLRWRVLALGGAAALLFIGTAFLVLRAVERTEREQIAKQMNAVLEIGHTSTHRLLERRQLLNAAMANCKQFMSMYLATFRGENVADLKERITDLLPALGMHGWALIDADGRVQLAGGGCEGWNEAPPNLRLKLSNVLDGESLLLTPSLLPVAGGDEMALLVAANRIMNGEKAVGLLAMTTDPSGQMSDTLEDAHFGETGETFVVDMNGILCSRSRFCDEFKAVGMLPSDAPSAIGRFRVARPPTPLAEGVPAGHPPSWPLTTAAAGIMSGKDGLELDHAFDYRGEPVVTAWKVCPEHQLGLATKMDYHEAFAVLQFMRLIFGGLLALVAVTGGLGVIWAVRAQRLQHTLAKAQKDHQSLGQYQMVRKLGQGGMGTVYLASHALMRRQTAVKLITGTVTPETAARFAREVRLSCQLTHPNSIAVYDFGQTADGTFYYAMEYLEGMDLDTMVAHGGPMPASRVIHFLIQTCGSLAEAHRMKMIHRDIKPGNLFVTRRGGIPDFLKVLDFGLAKSTDQNATKLSMENVVSGTPGYLAPEAMQGLELDGRSDLYSLGCVAYFLLTGELVFDGKTAIEIAMAHVQETPRPPSAVSGRTLPPDFEMVIMRCLEKNPDDRPQDALDLRTQLQMCEDAGKWTEADAEAWWTNEAGKILEKKHGNNKQAGVGTDSKGNDLPALVVEKGSA